MANTVTLTTIFDGSRRVVAKVDIIGDASGEAGPARRLQRSIERFRTREAGILAYGRLRAIRSRRISRSRIGLIVTHANDPLQDEVPGRRPAPGCIVRE